MPAPCSLKKRWQIVTLVEEGHQFKDIAERLRVGRNTVGRIMDLYRRTGQVTPGKSTGCPRKTTERQDRQLFRLVRRDRKKSARRLMTEWSLDINVQVSTRTTNRRINKHGYRARRPARKPMLTRRHRQERLAWARQWRHLTVNHWRHIIFADESRFELHRADGRVRVRRLAGERLQDDCVVETVGHGGGSVHVWGAMHAGGVSALVVLEGNVNGLVYRDILEHHMLPWARGVFGDNFGYQDDNAPPHRARITTNFLEEEEVQRRPQPARSPDLNPMPRSLEAVINSCGGHTKY